MTTTGDQTRDFLVRGVGLSCRMRIVDGAAEEHVPVIVVFADAGRPR